MGDNNKKSAISSSASDKNPANPETSKSQRQGNPLPNNQNQLQMFPQSVPSITHSLPIKLDDGNYMLWKNQLLNIIIANGLEDFIEGTCPCPPKLLELTQQTLNPLYQQWQCLNRLLMSWIYACLTPRTTSYIVNHGTAYEIWEALSKRFESTSYARFWVSDLSLLISRKKGLGPEYDAFVTSIENRVDKPSIEDVEMSDNSWFMDSEATHHMTPDIDCLSNSALFQGNDQVMVGNGPNLISWSSSKQKVVSRSSAESEYRALANGAAELSWIEYILQELQIPFATKPLLLCDNINATYLAANPIMHARTKHIEIDYHFVRERVLNKSLSVQYTSLEDQIADALAKVLPTHRFLNLRSKLTVRHSPVSLRGDVRICY
ncbi:hypothetical protein EZV62_004485 [Acer yangbiense]|uniref:Retrotransposon Copia-like N-terminal domain-containing protein n=1 Tax=Acer yangbiense TaxID=1000413 RepID=A0A5C7IK20_9ROSI|nr:hypothetical protein EZV62_004485 [Acer yangbiense]